MPVQLRKLPDINQRGLYRRNNAPSGGKPNYANSNAEILSYQRASGLEPKPDYYSAGLNRAKSKDHLLKHEASKYSRDKYLIAAGAQQILAGGRVDRERLLMDRYRRGTESEQELGVRRQHILSDEERQNEKLERLR